jgi:ribosome maturation factor RimP
LLKRDQIVKEVWETLEKPLADAGYALIEVEFGRQGGSSVLRLFIDSPEGITLDDCQAATNLVNPILDEEDLIPDQYMLEMSSPGIDRPLRRAEDFEQFAGEEVKIQTNVPVEGRSRFKGKLGPLEDGMVSIECDGREYQIHVENLKKARLAR